MQSLFIIDGVDYTKYVNKRSYVVHEVQVISTWTDANYKKHSDLLRNKISGTFTMTFTDANEYNSFASKVNENRGEDGKVPVTMYVDGRNALVSFNSFLDVSEVKAVFSEDAFGGNPVVFGVSVTVEEE